MVPDEELISVLTGTESRLEELKEQLVKDAQQLTTLTAEVEHLRFIRDVIVLTAANDAADELWWREDNGKLEVAVNCNDLFGWATADCEEITPQTLPVLRRAFEDARATHKYGHIYGTSLYAARVRGMRPQNACYPDDMPELWPLYDDAGPAREPDTLAFGNPHQHPTKKLPVKPSITDPEKQLAEARARIAALEDLQRTGVYAVVRVEGKGMLAGVDDATGLERTPPGPPFLKVKEVLTTYEEAQREVARLNKLNGDKDCAYFWQGAHFFLDGTSHGSAEGGRPPNPLPENDDVYRGVTDQPDGGARQPPA